MSFNPPLVLCIVAVLLCVGYYLYVQRRKHLANKAKTQGATAARRPPTTNHQVINMPSNSGRGTVPYYGQEYPTLNANSNPRPSSSTCAYDQPPPFKPEEVVTLPPPAYNEHKNDVRLPTGI
ncbi:hypothetical protein BCR42DRAFT_408584 [Absidia repens]|uniref:Uncharacterized protein n=1 Tax=Absidia repens TaxID=90262 RepID=A0A1X2IPZ9_9FUNG|nr:hypothetical protein BCR42DRAFT_408584 [Absidia repens]